MAEPSPLPGSRPQTPLEATRYDAIKALWRPRNLSVTPSDIREGLKSYWDLVRTIRDRWKSDAAAVKEAEDKKRNSELPLLQDRVKNQRDMIEVAFKAALEYGHKQIIELYVSVSPCVLRWSSDKNFLCSQSCLRGLEAWNRGRGYKEHPRLQQSVLRLGLNSRGRRLSIWRELRGSTTQARRCAYNRPWYIYSTAHVSAEVASVLYQDNTFSMLNPLIGSIFSFLVFDLSIAFSKFFPVTEAYELSRVSHWCLVENSLHIST